MLEVAEALAIVLQHCRPLQPVVLPLGPAQLGRVLMAEVRADRDSPPFAKSLRDGFAIRLLSLRVHEVDELNSRWQRHRCASK